MLAEYASAATFEPELAEVDRLFTGG